MNTMKTTAKRSAANYQFFKAICCNGNHFLCDFSNEKLPGNKLKYLVDIEIPGRESLHIEMQQADDNKWHSEMPIASYKGLEQVLDDVIYSYTVLN